MTIKYLLVLCTVASLAVGCEKVNRTEDSGAEVAPLVPTELTLAEQKVRDASNDFGLNATSGTILLLGTLSK